MENHLSQGKPSVYGLTLFSINLLSSKISVLFEPMSDRRFVENRVKPYQMVFLQINDFPIWVIKQISVEEKHKYTHQNIEDNDSNVINTETANKRHLLVLSYQGEQGSRLVKSLKRSIAKLLPEATQLEFGFTGSKLSTHLRIKDKTELNI